ncbi:MAG: LysM peptidoglycan-binding domain-containing protein [Muribaculaceae bacterium]
MKKTALQFIALCTLALTSVTAWSRQNVNTIKETIVDKSIVFPESFETDTKALMNNWYLKNYTVLDSYVENSKSETVSDEVYIKRLRALPVAIEMPFNSVVKTYIEMYTERRRTLVEEMLGMSLYYMPIFEQALEKEGLPLELKYLPVIESALNPDAVSRVGATGLWQFMISTAKGLGLEVNSMVDERRDPYRASEKAAVYLKNLYNIYHDWSLVIAAYNCGPGNVNKALRRAGGSGKDFWAIYPYLPKETRGYVPAFIAANYVMTYFKNHNISPSLAKKPLLTDTITVNQRINFNQISKVLNMPIDELRVLNPQFRRDVIPGDTHSYSLCLPTHQIYSFIMSKDSILNYRTDLYGRRDVVEPATISDSQDIQGVEGVDFTYETQTVTKWHKVRRGETLAKIAGKYGVTSSSIKRANGLRKSSVKRGQSLKIVTTQRVKVPIEKSDEPASDELLAANNAGTELDAEQTDTEEIEVAEPAPTTVKPAEQPKAKPEPKQKEQPKTKEQPKKRNNSHDADIVTKHTVRSGESLYKIATDNGITVDELKAANNLTNDAVKAGQTLVIPAKGEAAKHAAATKPEQKTSKYTVRKGDNLGKIAAKHGITVDQLKELNNLTDNNIMVGQSIVVPGDGEQAATKPAKAEREKPRTVTHTVRSGETLGAIAEKYGTTVSAIKRASGIKSDRISIGQKLTIPKKK